MSITSERINNLARAYNYEKYLEIGVASGDTFNNVKMCHRSAVDPQFRYNIEPYVHLPKTFFFNKTSDEFFSEMDDIQSSVFKELISWDIIYIDGLHTFQQAMKDFTNSMKFSHANTLWIFDDTIPCDPWSSLPTYKKASSLRRMAGLGGNSWHGDVYKCIFAIHDFYPDISYATVYDNGNPQTICWRTNWQTQRKRSFNSFDEIKNLSYFDMLEYAHILNLIKDGDLQHIIGQNVKIEMTNSETLLPLIIKRLHN